VVAVPTKVPNQHNQKKKGRTLQEKRVAKKLKKAKTGTNPIIPVMHPQSPS
jgi:hypothetical protein